MIRRRRYRRPALFWLVAVALTALTVSTVSRVSSAASAERRRWGDQRAVVVARHDLRPGERLHDVDVRMVPAALVPRDALTRAGSQTVAAWIAAGEIVVGKRLAPRGVSATAARLPAGTRGVAVPVGQAPLPVEIGDVVDVVAADDTSAETIARDAVVIAVHEAAVTVAIDEVDAAQVAYAVNAAAVTLILSGVR